MHHFEGKQIRNALDRRKAAVHIVAQKEEFARSQMHAQLPHVLGEKFQIREIAVDVSEHVDRTRDGQTTLLLFKD